MRLKLKTVPAIEPITLEEAKLHLKVDSADDNTLISGLITTARELAEKETKRAFITQVWQMFFDEAPDEIEIPKPPLQSVESIKAISEVESYVDENSATGQPILKVASTVGFTVADTVIINRDGDREEKLIILSIQTGISLTMTTNLTKEHTLLQADVVEKYILASKTSYHIDTSENSPGRIKLKSGYSWPTHRGFASFIITIKAGYGDAAADIPYSIKQAILQVIGHLYENRESQEVPDGAKSILHNYKLYTI